MSRFTINSFSKYKQLQQKISMISCYEYWSAKLLAQSEVDCLLVGDSVAMVLYGHPSTLHATVDMMEQHTAAVRRASSSMFIVADMPFLSFRKGASVALEAAGKLLRAGANAVKIEGIDGIEDTITALVQAGIPVMGHLGLTPQSIEQIGGFKVQGRQSAAATKMIRDAQRLEQLGAFSLVLECVPLELATTITQELSIATIGIGAGSATDGQVLVLHDLLGVDGSFYPKFLKKFHDGQQSMLDAINHYAAQVKNREFPTLEHSFH